MRRFVLASLMFLASCGARSEVDVPPPWPCEDIPLPTRCERLEVGAPRVLTSANTLGIRAVSRADGAVVLYTAEVRSRQAAFVAEIDGEGALRGPPAFLTDAPVEPIDMGYRFVWPMLSLTEGCAPVVMASVPGIGGPDDDDGYVLRLHEEDMDVPLAELTWDVRRTDRGLRWLAREAGRSFIVDADADGVELGRTPLALRPAPYDATPRSIALSDGRLLFIVGSAPERGVRADVFGPDGALETSTVLTADAFASGSAVPLAGRAEIAFATYDGTRTTLHLADLGDDGLPERVRDVALPGTAFPPAGPLPCFGDRCLTLFMDDAFERHVALFDLEGNVLGTSALSASFAEGVLVGVPHGALLLYGLGPLVSVPLSCAP